MTRASLIIPTYNRGELLCRTIEMALDQSYDDYEVIVVDQTRDYPAEIRAQLDALTRRVRYITLHKPNLPAARNAGFRQAHGEIIIFIDDDVIIDRDYVSAHVANFNEANTGAVAGLTLGSPTADPEETFAVARWWFQARQDFLLGERGEMTWVNGGNTAYARSALVAAGLWDEYFAGSGWFEDADISVRIRGRGYRVLLDSRIRLVHLNAQQGGSETRNPSRAKQIEFEQTQYYSYYLGKNRRILGTRRAAKMLYRHYRTVALNRPVLRSGATRVAQKNWLYACAAARGLADSLRSQ